MVDANIVIAAVIAPSGITDDLLFSPKLECVAPEFIENELNKHFPEIVKKSKVLEKDIRLALELIFSRIEIIPSGEYELWREKAKGSSPDPNDSEYLAVALAFNCPLWSNDKALKSQSAVKVFSTSELLQFLA
ncbi:hypothetical protein HYX13_00885 [Candidatus Woesearchaeota archaeon]|nr:hypothetical protein [Candidatus Woesearchaeota archaeon]